MALLSQLAGNALDYLGTRLGLPEMGRSEAIAGGPTLTTGKSLSSANYWSQPSNQSVLGASTQYPTSGPQTMAPIQTMAPTQSYGGNMSFGDPNNPDRSNPIKETDYQNWLASQNQGGGDYEAEQRRLAEEQARIQLENALREFDRYKEEAEAQKVELGQQRGELLSGYEKQEAKAKEQAGLSTMEAEEATTTAKREALGTAQDVQRKNRNVLRALGILSSSAAGEMLAKPFNELAKVSGDLGVQLTKRKGEIDRWLNERQSEIADAVTKIDTQYQNLIGQINRDIRYSGEQRASAVEAASNALNQTLSDIRTQALAQQEAANQYTSQMLQQMAQIQLYQNPQANVSGILSAAINAVNPGYSGYSQVLTEQEKRKLSGY